VWCLSGKYKSNIRLIKALPYCQAVISGLLLGLAWNSIIPTISLFVAFIPILFLLQNTNNHNTKIFNLSFLAFLIFHFIVVWWLSQSSVIGFIVIVLLNSFFMAIVILLCFLSWKKHGSIIGILSFLLFWLSFEYIHYRWEFSWPFMNLGNWLGQIPEIIQWYEYTGVLGGTLWILIINILLFLFVKNLINKKFKQSILAISVSIFIVLVPVLISKSLYNNSIEIGTKVKIKIIQPNINPYTEKYNSKLFGNQIKRHFELAEESDSSQIDCYLFPESSFPVYLDEQQLRNNLFLQSIDSQIIMKTEKSVLGGLYSFKIVESDTLFYNTAFMLNSDIQIYHKSKLVMGVERMPFQQYLKFLKKLNFDFGGYSSSLTADNQRKVFFSKEGTMAIAPIICYESIYGEFVSEFIKKGAASIAVITNDGWWGDTPALPQILMHAQLRAIETRKYLARAANTGVSCFINQKGEIDSQTRPWEQNSLSGSIYQNKKLTFYTRNGDFIGRIALYSSIILILYRLSIHLKQKTANRRL